MDFNEMLNMISKMDSKELQEKLAQAQSIINSQGGPQAFINNMNNNKKGNSKNL
jgi:hypothetical protein